jgi:hypothetical protein
MPVPNLELSKEDRTRLYGLRDARETLRLEVIRLKELPASVEQMQLLSHAVDSRKSLREQIEQLIFKDDAELTTLVTKAYPGINVKVRSDADLELLEFIFPDIQFKDVSEFDEFRTSNPARYYKNPAMKQALQFYQTVENARQIVQTAVAHTRLSFTFDPKERDDLVTTLRTRIGELAPIQVVVKSRVDEVDRSGHLQHMYMYNNTGIWFGNGAAPSTPPVPTPFLAPAVLEVLNNIGITDQKDSEHCRPRR